MTMPMRIYLIIHI